MTATAPQTPAIFPAWFAARQQDAWERYLATPTPKRGDETWRFSNLKQLDLTGFSNSAGLPPANNTAILARSNGLAAPAAKFVFINDELIYSESRLPEGVICLPLATALVSHGDLVAAHFMQQQTRLGSAKFAALHEAAVSNGLFVHTGDGAVIDGTIEVHHWMAGPNTLIFPHTLVVAGAGSKCRVIDIFRSVDDLSPGFAIAFNDLYAGPDSQLDYVAIQAFNEVTRVIQINATSTTPNASAKGFILNTGGSWVRNESLSRLDGAGSRSDILAVAIPAREQEYDQRTYQHHVAAGATSDLLYKNALYDNSKTVFSGLIFVDTEAHHTDAYQTCRNLLMSDTCEANSMPGLEINADQVKCSHGSTSSQIHDDEIFYLCARGIDPLSARQLIARGFAADVVGRLGDDATAALVMSFIDAKFARLTSGGA